MNMELMYKMNNELNGAITNELVSLQLGLCPLCGDIPGSFRDALSAKEYRISGMCQICQDRVFGGEE
jgi:hypothetical protein